MDKRKQRSVSFRKLWKKIKPAAEFAARTVLSAAGSVLGVYVLVSLAKNGSPIFYYAAALSSPNALLESVYSEDFPLSGEEIFLPERENHDEAPPEESTAEETGAQTEKEVPEVPPERRGTVKEVTYSATAGKVYIPYGGALIKNCTKLGSEKILAMLEKKCDIKFQKDLGDTPQVLVYHTHATEGFEPLDRGYFDLEATWRSTDLSENMAAVGEVFCSVLTEKGIGVLHDVTLHDDPSYSGSYKRSAVTVSKHLAENPEIKVCLDLHRDAIEPDSQTIMKPTVLIDGKKAAQIMIISGCDDGTMNMPDYAENLRFAAAIAEKAEEMYPGLCRPVLFDYRKYNMDLSPGLLLIEIGATGNTLEEAEYSAAMLAEVLAELLTE